MSSTEKISLSYRFLKSHASFSIKQFTEATKYSESTAKKYLSSQLGLYVRKNGDVYEIVRSLPSKPEFQKLFKQTSRVSDEDVMDLLEKSKNSALSAISHYNSPYTHGKAITFIPQMFIASTSLLIAIIKKYKHDEELYEKDKDGNVVIIDGKKKIKYLIDLLKTYQSIHGIKLDAIEIKTFVSLVEILRQVRNEIEHGAGNNYKLDMLLDGQCHALLMNYEQLLNREFDTSIGTNLAFPLFISETLSEEQKMSAKAIQQKEYKVVKDIITTYNNALDEDIVKSNYYNFKIWAFPKVSSNERNSDMSIEYVNISDLTEEQKEEIEKNFIAVREKTVLEYRPSVFAEMVKKKLEKHLNKKIKSFTSAYHLNNILKILKWRDNKEYRATNPTYKMDYYTEKARVELFKLIQENPEDILRKSKAKLID